MYILVIQYIQPKPLFTMNMNIFYKEIVKGLINEFSNGRNYHQRIKRGQYFGPILNDQVALGLNKRTGEIAVFHSGIQEYVHPIIQIHVDQTSLQIYTLSTEIDFPNLSKIEGSVYKICTGHS